MVFSDSKFQVKAILHILIRNVNNNMLTKTIALCILFLWVVTIVFFILLLILKVQKKYTTFIAVVVCLLLITYYFPQVNWLPTTVHIDYVLCIPYTENQFDIDEESFISTCNDHIVFRSAWRTLFNHTRVFGDDYPAYSILAADYMEPPYNGYTLTLAQKTISTVSFQSGNNIQVYYILKGGDIFELIREWQK